MRKRSFEAVALAAGLSAAAVALAACGGSGGSGAGAEAKTIRLGLIGPISGAQSQIGTNQVAGAQVAVDQINAAGGVLGKQATLESADEGASSATAAAAIRRYAADGVQAQARPAVERELPGHGAAACRA
ncbi:hypothetical protein GCM10025868_09410 [Angustibacter aerolatus]|uniref:Leucine-binding protein domain-containing protein n=1 Tax=Angustibacter aerolatus TaxID=1162965 RepID=A0ABQ6JBY4_9ACTN|nr:ABC transporter substrate-binding protein [Angustibacter aerolatus]GMA85691.1 hypothetical protein GCM10025868_09410 [Angustibacter aerolatus]